MPRRRHTFNVGDDASLRHGPATLTGTITKIEGHKATLTIPREGQEPLVLTRNVNFLTPPQENTPE